MPVASNPGLTKKYGRYQYYYQLAEDDLDEGFEVLLGLRLLRRKAMSKRLNSFGYVCGPNTEVCTI